MRNGSVAVVEGYQRRILDGTLDELQPQLAAIELFGAKAVGKTAMAAQRAKSVLHLDLARDRERVQSDPSFLTTLPGPLLLDEWTRVPEVWDEVRHAVDSGVERGRFLLTGSATVPRGVSVHSGAGRIISFRLRPLSFSERGYPAPSVSLRALLGGNSADIHADTAVGLADYVHEIVASGFPGIRAEPPRLRQLQLDGYLHNLVQREFPEQGYPVRRPALLRAWLSAYAAATATATSYNRILDASTPGVAAKPAKTTTQAYRDALASLWILDPLDAWLPSRNRLQRLGAAPKHFLSDPALACRLLSVDEVALLSGSQGPRTLPQQQNLREGTLLGALFEHLVVLSIKTYAQAADASTAHLRTQGGTHAVDVIVQRFDGAVVAFEVKLSQSVTDQDVKHLLWLREQLGDTLVESVVLTTGEHAYRRRDGVAVVPFALLGP